MAGLSTGSYDADILQSGLVKWCANQRDGQEVEVSPLSINPSSGFSSQSFLFDVVVVENADEKIDHLVLRLPPPGDGLFPTYDLARQAEIQNRLVEPGFPTAAPARYEPDTEWLGTDFLVMSCIGRIPNDYLYCVKGWLHDAAPQPTSETAASPMPTHFRLFTASQSTQPPGVSSSGPKVPASWESWRGGTTT